MTTTIGRFGLAVGALGLGLGLALVLAASACSGKAKEKEAAAGGSGGAAGAAGAGGSAATACPKVVAKLKSGIEQALGTDEQAEAMAEKSAAILAASCAEDGWPGSLRACIVAAPEDDVQAFAACEDAAPAAIKQKLDERMKAMRPPPPAVPPAATPPPATPPATPPPATPPPATPPPAP
ncbi:MAG TPA: hypothetical protein VHE35_31820 [Kofleriaceae bacterium]|nr:hypothetical protein [Kofleriaceae bacterium]